jgi:hypothetical protein
LGSTALNIEFLKVVNEATKKLKSANAGKIQELMEEIAEQNTCVKEIAEVIARPPEYAEVNENDLLAELEELVQVILNNIL